MVHPLFNFRAILYISIITVIIKLLKKKTDESSKKFKVKIKIKGDLNELNNEIQKIQKKEDSNDNKKEDSNDNKKDDLINNINITATSNKLTLEEKKQLLNTSLWDVNW